MGTALFERLPQDLRLTAAGALLLRRVHNTLKEHDRMPAQAALKT